MTGLTDGLSGDQRALVDAWENSAAQLASIRTHIPGVPAVLDPEEYTGTVSTWVRHWAQERPQTVAVHFYGRDITFAEFDSAVDHVAGWLQAQGVGQTDRVAVYMGNCPQFLIAFTAIMRLGAVHVPVNPMFRSTDLAYELRDATPTVIIAQTELRPIVDEVLPDLGFPLICAYTNLGDMLTQAPAPAAPFGLPREQSDWEAILSHPAPAELPDVDPTALAALNYTGGTTGMPKGCEHTHEHMVYTAVSTLASKGRTPGSHPEVFLCFLPVFWIAGENGGILGPLVNGSTVVLLTRYHPGAVAELLHSQRVTSMVAPADAYVELLALEGFRDRDYALDESLAVSFVKKLDTELRRQWQEVTGVRLREAAFGMTETHTMDTSTYGLDVDDADLAGEPIYTGYPVPGTAIVIVDDSLQPVPSGQAGQILVNSPSILTRYYNKPEATRDSLIAGWLQTGDTGRFDARGGLTYLARTKELIKVNGMSVFPAEVETVIRRHPAVVRVAVAPREDAAKGQVPVAFVELRDGEHLTAADIVTWLTDTIAAYKVPEVVIVTDMPMTATGKIRKVELIAGLSAGAEAEQ